MRSKAVFTIEEHSVNGALGSRVASFLMQNRIYRPFHIMGIPDEHTVTGSQVEIFNHYGISPDGISRIALYLLEPAALRINFGAVGIEVIDLMDGMDEKRPIL